MTIDLTTYGDRFNETTPYEKVLYNRDNILQASELTEQQSILHHYLGEMGEALFTDGDVQSGLDYTIATNTLTMNTGKVYLAGKVRSFSQQSVPFVTTGKFEVGLKLKQEIITHTEDDELLDKTGGFESYYSIGADRLKATVILVSTQTINEPELSRTTTTTVDGEGTTTVVLVTATGTTITSTTSTGVITKTVTLNNGTTTSTITDAKGNVTTSPEGVTATPVYLDAVIYTFIDGDLFLSIENPEMSKINKVLAERTYDESGNYRVSGFDLYTEAHPTDETQLMLVVEPGRAYVRGYQVDKPTSTRIAVPRSLTKRLIQNESFYFSTANQKSKLGNKPVASISKVAGQVAVVKETVNRGVVGDSMDSLSKSAVFAVNKVWTEVGGVESKVYVAGTDYQLVNGSAIDWSPAGLEPAAGTTYYVSYTYMKTMIKDTDYKVTITGEGDNRVWYIDFTGMNGARPLENTLVLTDYNYYLARKDLVVLDQGGNITVHLGQPDSTNAVSAPNHLDPYTLPLGTILIYPDSTTSRPVKSAMNRLSMAELQKLKTRIENLEYNDAVNALDKPAMEGINPVTLRGVFSDGFISMNKADLTHPDTKIAFSFEDAEITLPYASSTIIKPTYIDDSLANNWGRLVTAPFTEEKDIFQTNVSEAFNVNPYNIFNKAGMLKISPSEDNWIEESRITVTQQETEVINVNRWWKHEGESWVEDEISSIQNITLDDGQSWTQDMGHDLTLGAYTGTTLKSGGTQTIESMIEFIRQQEISFEATNLTPNANNLVISFDGVVAPITPASGFNVGTTTGSIQSNALGVAKGTFNIPAGIRTGTREVTLRNADNTASTTYIAQGTHKTTQDIIIRTRVTVNLTDPLAQSFQFTENKVVTSIGLFFGSKSATNNIMIQVRGISEGGMPNKTVYAETVLTPDQVNVSANGAVETKVSFDDPLVVDAGKEYCVVAITDNSDYTMWTATRGQVDLVTKEIITSNPYLTGVLYSSSNASAWTIHQDTDLKFTIYTARFNETAVIDFDTITNLESDRVVSMATYLTPSNTGCKWQIKLIMQSEGQDVTMDSKPWVPIGNYADVELAGIVRALKLRATFTANQNMSPMLSLQDLTVASFLSSLAGSYVSRTIEMSEAPFNTVRVSYDSFLPAGATAVPRYSTDGGITWKAFTVQPSVSTQTNEFTRYVFEELIGVGDQTFTSFKVRIDMATQNSFIRPRARRLMCSMTNA